MKLCPICGYSNSSWHVIHYGGQTIGTVDHLSVCYECYVKYRKDGGVPEFTLRLANGAT